jgi:hypothetical protein
MSDENIHRFHDFRSFSQFVFENGAATTRKTVAIRRNLHVDRSPRSIFCR